MEEFADMGQITGCTFSELQGPPYDLIINATSVSLQGEMPEMPVGLVAEETCLATAIDASHRGRHLTFLSDASASRGRHDADARAV